MAKSNIISTIPDENPDAPKLRVEEELKELSIKIHNLRDFIGSERFDRILEPGKTLLRKQLAVMEEYAEILHMRLRAWRK